MGRTERRKKHPRASVQERVSPGHGLYSKVVYLTPTRRADTDREDCEEPRVDLAEPSEEREEGGPYTDEECGNEDEDLPVLECGVPQEGPVLSIGLGNGRLETNDAENRIGLTPLSQ